MRCKCLWDKELRKIFCPSPRFLVVKRPSMVEAIYTQSGLKFVKLEHERTVAAPGIYLLIDPETFAVRYVGKSKRLRDRESDWRCEEIHTNKNIKAWIKSLKAKGLRPRFEILLLCDEVYLSCLEIYWIKRLSESHNLLNMQHVDLKIVPAQRIS